MDSYIESSESSPVGGRLINTVSDAVATKAEIGPHGFNLISLPKARKVELSATDPADIPPLGPSAPRPANLQAVLRERRLQRAATHPRPGASNDQHKATVQHNPSLEHIASGQSNEDDSSSGGGARRGGVLNLRPNQTARAWAMEQIYTAPPPVALAPLRWNLVKVERDFADSVADVKANVRLYDSNQSVAVACASANHLFWSMPRPILTALRPPAATSLVSSLNPRDS